MNEQNERTGNQNNQQGNQGGNQRGGDGQGEPGTFDAWLERQDDAVKGLISTHTSGLKTALESERGTRKEQEKQLRELAAKAEKGSEAQRQLTELADRLSATDKRVAAYEALSAAGCGNLKLAWLAASEAGLVDGQGNVNVEKLKGHYPELFKTAQPKGNAGSGAGQAGAEKPDMNAFIRRAAGRT